MLGDRIRLADHFLDPGVFIRSMATRGSLGGLAEAALQAALLMDASGKDDVLLETVGVGQGEIDIVDHADTIVLALMPGSGDSIQALKAGRDGDPRRDRRQQGRSPAGRHDGPRGAGGARRSGRRAPGRCRGADRGGEGRGDRRAARADRRPPRAHRARPARSPSAGPATCAPRCWASPRRGFAAGSRSERRATRTGRVCWTSVVAPRDRPRHARRASCWRRSTMAEEQGPDAAEAQTWMAELESASTSAPVETRAEPPSQRSELRGDHRQPGVLAGVA